MFFSWKALTVSSQLYAGILCSWFKSSFIKLDLVTVGKFCFHFSRVLGSVVDCVNREFTKPRRQRERERR